VQIGLPAQRRIERSDRVARQVLLDGLYLEKYMRSVAITALILTLMFLACALLVRRSWRRQTSMELRDALISQDIGNLLEDKVIVDAVVKEHYGTVMQLLQS